MGLSKIDLSSAKSRKAGKRIVIENRYLNKVLSDYFKKTYPNPDRLPDGTPLYYVDAKGQNGLPKELMPRLIKLK